MTDPLSFTVTVGCLFAAVVLLALDRAALPLVLLVEGVLVVQAVLDVVGLLRGHHPAEPAVHLAYLATSVLVLPAGVSLAAEEESRWAGVLLAVALVVAAVVVVRMQATWRG